MIGEVRIGQGECFWVDSRAGHDESTGLGWVGEVQGGGSRDGRVSRINRRKDRSKGEREEEEEKGGRGSG